MKKLLFPLFLLLFTVAMRAQIQDPVKFKSELKLSLIHISEPTRPY